MLARILASATMLVGLSQVGMAQNSPSSNDNSTNNNGQQSATQPSQTIPQELRKKLSDAGFTDVKIIPSSFFVTAKNKQGQDVMMRIGPNSMTMLTEVPTDGTSTTGAGSAASGNSQNGSNGSVSPSSAGEGPGSK